MLTHCWVTQDAANSATEVLSHHPPNTVSRRAYFQPSTFENSQLQQTLCCAWPSDCSPVLGDSWRYWDIVERSSLARASWGHRDQTVWAQAHVHPTLPASVSFQPSATLDAEIYQNFLCVIRPEEPFSLVENVASQNISTFQWRYPCMWWRCRTHHQKFDNEGINKKDASPGSNKGNEAQM